MIIADRLSIGDRMNTSAMNDLPLIEYPCLRKELWDRQGANIVARRKYIAKSCFDVQKTILEKDQRFFAVVLLQMKIPAVIGASSLKIFTMTTISFS